MINKTQLSLLFAAACILASTSVHAISIRDDVADDRYVVSDNDYPALVDLFEPGDCIGTLIHPSFLLTVAHCAADLSPGQSLTVNGTPKVIEAVLLHSSWQDEDTFDIGLVRFEAPVETVEPLPIYRGSDELGSVITLVGRGVITNGLQGEVGASSDGKLRRATNIVTAADAHTLQVVFERPGEDGATELEGVGVSGDSGCPVFIDVEGVPTIVGLNSFGDAEDDADVGRYGSRDYQTRISQYLDWIDGHIDWSEDSGPGGDNGSGDDSGDDSSDDPANAGCSAAGQGSGGGLLLILLLATLSRRRQRSVR